MINQLWMTRLLFKNYLLRLLLEVIDYDLYVN
jgi:hypothetical protein